MRWARRCVQRKGVTWILRCAQRLTCIEDDEPMLHVPHPPSFLDSLSSICARLHRAQSRTRLHSSTSRRRCVLYRGRGWRRGSSTSRYTTASPMPPTPPRAQPVPLAPDRLSSSSGPSGPYGGLYGVHMGSIWGVYGGYMGRCLGDVCVQGGGACGERGDGAGEGGARARRDDRTPARR